MVRYIVDVESARYMLKRRHDYSPRLHDCDGIFFS